MLGVSIPTEVGGIGASFLEEAIVGEEMYYANCVSPDWAVHSTICMPYLRHYGTKEQSGSHKKQKQHYDIRTRSNIRGSQGSSRPLSLICY